MRVGTEGNTSFLPLSSVLLATWGMATIFDRFSSVLVSASVFQNKGYNIPLVQE